ncbi:MAG: hypothetical protein AB9883_03220 [Acidaminococcaceae bacterium]
MSPPIIMRLSEKSDDRFLFAGTHFCGNEFKPVSDQVIDCEKPAHDIADEIEDG